MLLSFMSLMNELFMSVLLMIYSNYLVNDIYRVHDNIHNSTTLGYAAHPVQLFANDENFNATLEQVDWKIVLGNETIDGYVSLTFEWVAYTLPVTLILILSSYRFLKNHVWARYTNRNWLSIVKNDAGSFDKAGCWLFLILIWMYCFDSIVNFSIIMRSIFSKLNSTSGRGFYIQSGFFLFYYYGNFVASCILLCIGYLLKKLFLSTCLSSFGWIRKLYYVIHKVLTSTLLGVFGMLPEIKKFGEEETNNFECAINCKLCAKPRND